MIAGIYARLSSADEDTDDALSHSVQSQLRRCRKLANELGWEVVAEYPEDATSAFKKRLVTLPDGRKIRRNVRPLWTQMLRDLYDGRITALVAYDLDRAMREPRDLEDLIEVVEQRGRTVQSVTGSLRLDNDSNILAARIGVGVANKSSRDTSRRVKDSMSWRVDEGRWHGGVVPFGYKITGGTVEIIKQNGKERERRTKGKLVPDPDKAPKIRDAAKRVLRGESLFSITEMWNRDGFLTAQGKHWRASTLSTLLTRASIAGMRKDGSGNLVPAQWKGILDLATFTKLQAFMSDENRRFRPAAVDSRGGKLTLGGLTFCAECGQRLIGQGSPRAPQFVCRKQVEKTSCGRVAINYLPLEAFVFDALFVALDGPGWHATLERRQTVGVDPTSDLVDELATLKDQVTRVGEAYSFGAFTKTEAETRTKDLRSQIEELERRISQTASDSRFDHVRTSAQARRILETSDDVVMRRALLARFIDRIEVKKTPAGLLHAAHRRRGEDPEAFEARRLAYTQEVLMTRVVIRWRV